MYLMAKLAHDQQGPITTTRMTDNKENTMAAARTKTREVSMQSVVREVHEVYPSWLPTKEARSTGGCRA